MPQILLSTYWRPAMYEFWIHLKFGFWGAMDQGESAAEAVRAASMGETEQPFPLQRVTAKVQVGDAPVMRQTAQQAVDPEVMAHVHRAEQITVQITAGPPWSRWWAALEEADEMTSFRVAAVAAELF